VSDAYSLSDLNGIALPAEPGIWPLTQGMWILLVIALSAIGVTAWILYSRWRRNAYRRAGLVLLPDVRTIQELSILLKRVALAAYPRELVASLHSRDWLVFLNETGPAVDLEDLVTGEPESEAPEGLKDSARNWITSHGVGEMHSGGPGE